MPTPVVNLTNVTATGDVITGPGYPLLIAGVMPVATVGTVVTGSVCVGVISAPTSIVIAGVIPVATIGCVVTGVNPIIGVPVSTVCAMSSSPTNIM